MIVGASVDPYVRLTLHPVRIGGRVHECRADRCPSGRYEPQCRERVPRETRQVRHLREEDRGCTDERNALGVQEPQTLCRLPRIEENARTFDGGADEHAVQQPRDMGKRRGREHGIAFFEPVHARHQPSLVRKPRCEWSTAFGTPLEPEVKSTTAMSELDGPAALSTGAAPRRAPPDAPPAKSATSPSRPPALCYRQLARLAGSGEHERSGQARSREFVGRGYDYIGVDLGESGLYLGRTHTPMERCSNRPDPPARPEEEQRAAEFGSCQATKSCRRTPDARIPGRQLADEASRHRLRRGGGTVDDCEMEHRWRRPTREPDVPRPTLLSPPRPDRAPVSTSADRLRARPSARGGSPYAPVSAGSRSGALIAGRTYRRGIANLTPWSESATGHGAEGRAFARGGQARGRGTCTRPGAASRCERRRAAEAQRA